MTNERLTRQELSWLLAQEARGAARALREGVAQRKQPAGGVTITDAPAVETTLDALDDAIDKLSELQAGSVGKSARRGRIDLAALLYEIAPGARIAIEPGAGTEVFGEESDLRRMLHVLLSQTHSDPGLGGAAATPVISVRRDGHWVRIGVELGPDSSANLELEQRWLNRMAIRHGGRLELEGGTQSIFLPADGASDQREVAELRRELEQAQQLGEVYARELAAAFAAGDAPAARSEPPAADVATARLEMLVSVASSMQRDVRALTEALRADASEAAASLGERMSTRAAALSAHGAELARAAAADPREAELTFDPADGIRAAVADAGGRAARHAVALETELEALEPLRAARGLFELVVRSLIDHAIVATPRGEPVRVRGRRLPRGLELAVEDGAPLVPASAWQDLVRHRVDPAGLGRPRGLALLAAEAASDVLGGKLAIRESAAGRSELVFVLEG
ncbi:MAG: hypothetical protein OZ921_16130 [Sorangiineae bacterium]|nr:hypothetical protein [Sorangiineae bacterium]MEB2343290.1 hypothetical protein [Deltaproteobacteria bacterium]